MTNREPSVRRTGEQLARELAAPDILRTIITDETAEAVRLLDATAQQLGRQFARQVTTSQIRTIFGIVRMIEQDTKTLDRTADLPVPVLRELVMLRPKLAYQYGRVSGREDDSKKAAMGAMTIILSQSIELVGSSTAFFRNFVDFFEAILAYHRRFGGS